MDFTRKFYAATPGQGGGPSNEDLNNAESLNEKFARLRDTLASIGSILKEDIAEQLENFDQVARQAATVSVRDLGKEIKKAGEGIKQAELQQRRVGKELIDSAKIEGQINKLKDNQASIESTLAVLKRQGVELTETQAVALGDLTEALKEQLELLNQQLATSQKLERSIGIMGNFFKSLTQIPFLGSLLNAQSILNAMTKAASQTGSRWKALGAGITAAFKSIGSSLKDPTVLLSIMFGVIGKIINLIREFNQRTFDISKNLGVSVDKARSLQGQFIQISTDSKNLGLSVEDITKSFGELSQMMGFLVPSSGQFAETAALIQKRLGLSAQEMAALATQAAVSGMTLMDTYKTLQASRTVEGARSKLYLTEKQQLEAIAKLSSTVVLNFKGSTAALGEAVVRAAKLGTTLDTVNKQGEALLDFESSIGKEFEAQLLTGRDINLTRAREFALMGDTKNLMEELNRQGATYDQFMNQNVIARKAEAEAVGLSIEEYSKILLQQKQANILGAEQGESLTATYDRLVKEGKTRQQIVDLIGKSAEQDLYRSSINDKFTNALDKLKNTLGVILEGPLSNMVDKFAAFVSNAAEMNKLANNLKTVFSGIASVISNLPDIISKALSVTKALVSISIALAVARAAGAGSMLGIAGGIAAGGLMYAYLSSLTGGAGGAPPVPGGGGGEAMTTPLNTSAAMAQTTQAGGGTAATAPVFNFKQTTIVGTENWSNQTRTSLQQDFGTTLK
jgi:hypothetical protein